MPADKHVFSNRSSIGCVKLVGLIHALDKQDAIDYFSPHAANIHYLHEIFHTLRHRRFTV